MTTVPARSPITTHILDTARGVPAADVRVTLEFQETASDWRLLGEGVTNDDGRLATLLPAEYPLAPGVYRLTFDTDVYFAAHGFSGAFFPSASIVFRVAAEGGGHYHIPLLLSPFGYSTYRGS